MRKLRVRFAEFFLLTTLASFVSTRLPRLRLRRISLRIVLGLVAIAAVGMGWVVHRVRVQQEGIELIRRHGGMYYYDFENEGAITPNVPRSWAPAWLVKNLGVDYFHHVAWARIEDPKFNDDDLGVLTARLPRIDSLGIVGTSITDAGLSHLRGNRWLMALFLERNNITDAGIDNLGPETMPVFELLDVRLTRVSAAKIAAVEAIFDVRERAAKKAHPGMRISQHMVLSGYVHTSYLGRDPRGEYERSIAGKQSGP
jgi:hypothetical protein